jgi:O-antigen/teichoic acid export membrane protein
MAALLFFFKPFFFIHFHQPFFASLFFASGSLMLIFFQAYLSALKRFNIQNYLLIASNAVFLIWLYFQEYYFNNVGLQDIAIGYGSLLLLQALGLMIAGVRNIQKINTHLQLAPYLKQGGMIMLSSLFYFLFLRADNFFVERYASSELLGNYVQCGKVGQYFLYFSSIVSTTILPFMQSEGLGSSWKSWLQLIKPYAGLIILVAVGIALTGHWIFPWVFGPLFDDMYGFMLILLPGYVCLGMLTLLNAIYMAKGKIKRIFIGDLGGCVLLLVADSFLVPVYGAYAAAWISSIAYCLAFLYLLAGVKNLNLEPGN